MKGDNPLILGRAREDTEILKKRDAFLFGRKLGEEKENIYFDALSQHLILVFGKKGFGKSYTMSVLAEGMQSIEDKDNVSVILVDTMATFAGLKEPADAKIDLLKAYGLEPRGYNVRIFIPPAYIEALEEVGLSENVLKKEHISKLLIRPGDLEVFDWCELFDIPRNIPSGLLLEKAVRSLRKSSGRVFGLSDLKKEIGDIGSEMDIHTNVIDAVKNRIDGAEEWSIFDPRSTLVEEVAKGGQISILDLSYMSHISRGWTVRGLIVALLARQILRRRMMADRVERKEFGDLPEHVMKSLKFPKVWMMIDEAHQFLPHGRNFISSGPLIEWVRQGRKPGLSLVLATQRPSRLHEDSISQGDIVISHTLTAQVDISALKSLNQTWMKRTIQSYILTMPKKKGNAIVFDDTNKEILTVNVRVRASKEQGSTSTLISPDELMKIKEKEEIRQLEERLGV